MSAGTTRLLGSRSGVSTETGEVRACALNPGDCFLIRSNRGKCPRTAFRAASGSLALPSSPTSCKGEWAPHGADFSPLNRRMSEQSTP